MELAGWMMFQDSASLREKTPKRSSGSQASLSVSRRMLAIVRIGLTGGLDLLVLFYSYYPSADFSPDSNRPMDDGNGA